MKVTWRYRLSTQFISWWYGFDFSSQNHLPLVGGYIIAANHGHWADPFVISRVFYPGLVRWLSLQKVVNGRRLAESFRRHRWGLLSRPLAEIGAWLVRGSQVWPLENDLNRPQARRHNLALLDQVNTYVAQGGIVGIFPEGNMTASRQVNKGVAVIARHSGRPIIPVYLDWVNRRAIIGQPLYSVDSISDEALARQVIEAIYSLG